MTTVDVIMRDRKANAKELLAARRFVLDRVAGIGLIEAARRLGVDSESYASRLLAGKVRRRLLLSELRKLREGGGGR